MEQIESAAALRMAIGRLARALRTARASEDLTPTQISVLFTVCREGPLPLAALAEREALNPTMLSRVIGGLAERGLVDRTTAPGDRRSAVVAATRAGRALRERSHAARDRALAASLAQLTPSQRRAIDDALPALEALWERLR